jgi:hypothetical protein
MFGSGITAEAATACFAVTALTQQRAHVLHSFQIGDRVRLSELGSARCPTMPARGTVVALSRRATAVQVLMDGRKTPVLLHVSYLEAVRRVQKTSINGETEIERQD